MDVADDQQAKPTQTALAAKAFLERIDHKAHLGIIETRAKLGGWVGSRGAGSWDTHLSDAIAVAAWNAVLDLFRAWATEVDEAQGDAGEVPMPPHQEDCPARLEPLGPCTCEPPERYGDE